jgi:hypothetical protein
MPQSSSGCPLRDEPKRLPRDGQHEHLQPFVRSVNVPINDGTVHCLDLAGFISSGLSSLQKGCIDSRTISRIGGGVDV